MNDGPLPQTPRSYLSFIASRGGSARTPAQQAARKANLAKGRKARLKKLKELKNQTTE